MASSRTSGKVSAAEQAKWGRRRGNPGGPRSEAQKQGLAADRPGRASRATPEALRAFLLGDEAFFRQMPAFQGVWQDTPLVARLDRCTAAHPIDARIPDSRCTDQHEARTRTQEEGNDAGA
jgi:hypothetical protein